MSDESGTLETRIRLIVALLSLTYTTVIIWQLIPSHHRQLIKMRALAAGKKHALKLARRAGDASMAAELATGRENYHLAYGLAQLAELAGRAYDRCRDALT